MNGRGCGGPGVFGGYRTVPCGLAPREPGWGFRGTTGESSHRCSLEGLVMTKPAVTARSEAWHPPPGAELSGPYLTGRGKTRADDAALIELSGTQPEAFAAIFDRHATEIHRFAARRL